jgi:Fic family protein
MLSTEAVDAIVRAEEALRALQNHPNFMGLEVLSRQLLRAESIGSSWIEGLTLSHDRLLQAMFVPGAASETARAIIGNIEAMEAALALADSSSELTTQTIRDIHSVLFQNTRDAHIAGQIRDRQNWVDGDATSPRNAEFVPPPEDRVAELLSDLCEFLNRDDLPAVLQAAIAHAQFETIHPFADGNGRVGRALIHAVLRRRGATPRYVPPVSLVLATSAARYVRGLTSYRAGNLADWVILFCRTLVAAATQSEALADELGRLQDTWREAMGHPRRDSAAEKLIQALPARPILDARAAQELTGASDEATRKALNALEAAGVLTLLDPARRANRFWQAPAIIQLLDQFEWDLATPTQPHQPRRVAPER